MSEKTQRVAFITGIAAGTTLVLVGIIAYIITDFVSMTALIPSVLGLIFVVFGRLGLNADRVKVGLYGLGIIAILTVLGSVTGLNDLLVLATGGTVDRPITAISQGIMVVLSAIVLALIGRVIFEDRR